MDEPLKKDQYKNKKRVNLATQKIRHNNSYREHSTTISITKTDTLHTGEV